MDHTAQDLDGLTAADLAEECGHMTCAEFLRDYEPPPLPDVLVGNFAIYVLDGQVSPLSVYTELNIYMCI